MKIFLLLFFLCTFLPAEGNCEECTNSDDACRPRQEKLTPFMAELEKASAAPEKKRDPVKNTVKGTNNQAAAQQKEPAAEPTAAAADTALEATDAPPEKKEIISKPGWLVAAVLFLYGLYYFLKEGKKRKGKK